MARVKLSLRNLPIPQKIAKAQQIIAALTGNASFSTPTPSLATVSTAINNLDAAFTAAQAARQDAKSKTSDQNAKEDIVDGLMTQLEAYVESVAGNNEQLITSAGMDARAPATSRRHQRVRLRLRQLVWVLLPEITMARSTCRGTRWTAPRVT
jgi:hypothetical protein